MPRNLHALLRYQAIHARLKQPDLPSRWEDLAEACRGHMQERLGDGVAPAQRTILLDIKRMRDGDLGYEAPISFARDRGYYYTDANFEIHDLNLSKRDITHLREAIDMVRSVTQHIGAIAIDASLIAIKERLGLDASEGYQHIIHLERSPNDQGMQWINAVYEAARDQKPISVSYRSFDHEDRYHVISPSIIKEYNNRWYVIGYEHTLRKLFTLALDRVVHVKSSLQPYHALSVDIDKFFAPVYGVTRVEDAQVHDILLAADADLVPYLLTKPILPSQRVDTQHRDGSAILSCRAVINYELTSLLLGWGPALEVIEPAELRQLMQQKIDAMSQRYGAVEK